MRFVSPSRSCFLQFAFDQSKRKLRAVDRYVQVFQHIRQSADMILVSMSNQNASYFIAVFRQIRNIRDDNIDTEHIFFWEFQVPHPRQRYR